MTRFFNLIPGQGSCCILLYGEIGSYETIKSADIVRELIEAEAAYKDIDIKINSLGGEVYAGIAIFNAFRNSKANITIYIDGVAASIASVIAGCGKPVKMSRYARLMLHSIQGGVYGNISDMESCISEIKDLEDILCDIYSKRTGMTPEEIRSTYFDGKDHWLTADEALRLGFIDEIYDADPVPEDSTPEQVYTIYQNRHKVQPINNKSKMFEKLKKRSSFANCASEEDVVTHIDHLEAEAAKVSGLETENATLKTENEAYKKKIEEAEEKEIDTIVKNAADKGLISDPQKANFKAMMKSDRANAEAFLNTLQPKKRVMNNLGEGEPVEEPEDAFQKRQKEIETNLKNK